MRVFFACGGGRFSDARGDRFFFTLSERASEREREREGEHGREREREREGEHEKERFGRHLQVEKREEERNGLFTGGVWR